LASLVSGSWLFRGGCGAHCGDLNQRNDSRLPLTKRHRTRIFATQPERSVTHSSCGIVRMEQAVDPPAEVNEHEKSRSS
jgi:hypothetical protein